jgi:CHAT domain-containing protein
LTVHDLERLRQPPYRLVLSACDSGVAASVGGDDLLGLSTALLGLGTAGVLASCVPVNDAASVPVALAVHRALAGGADLAGALLAARQQADDPVVAATAASALPIGI